MSEHVEAKIEEYKRCGCGHCSDFLKTFAHMLVENRQLTAALAERDEARERVKVLESSLRIAETVRKAGNKALSAQLDTAWQQSAEAMREAVKKAAHDADMAHAEYEDSWYALKDAVHSMPVPERKEG